MASAFDSAGQRCSALRVLCLQDEVADRTLTMLRGALRELSVGRTDRLAIDIGPVIDDNAKRGIDEHIERMRKLGCAVEQLDLPTSAAKGTFVAPTIIELKKLSDLKREVFGPVLHIIRYKRKGLDRLIDDVNASGYGLTFGLHTRLDDTIAHVTSRVKAGNLYVNRNIIGAVVGVQPFGGRGLSGTGPKAGGPMYLRRLTASSTEPLRDETVQVDPAAQEFLAWLDSKGAPAAKQARAVADQSSLGFNAELPGPVGELNLYALHPRGRVLLVPQTALGLHVQVAAALATGNSIVIDAASGLQDELQNLPAVVTARISWSKDWAADGPFAGALIEGDAARVQRAIKTISALPGPLLLTQAASSEEIAGSADAYCLNWLLEEVTTSINTAAAGGNASLMTIG
ncbi:aldehyde dehydrogenase family protein [Rhizobium sp. P44RR-XXIV]|uniref:aldehyde dehydrogenase family protein n=1 Tax=Rhizobium sp. P44RR-XXIV TaxID=1921145 RepID=UPI0024847400|nr:aldehyde dehydrogenase family protein [Rhizobium sp. P44RR-XXIV]